MTVRRPLRKRKVAAYATPRERTSPRKAIVREELIARAAAVFQERGYIQTNIGDVARILGMSRSSLYHYFTNKDELIEIIVANEMEARERFSAPILAARDEAAAPRLGRMLRQRIEREFTRGISLRMFDQLDRGVPASVLKSVRLAHDKAISMYAEIIAQGIASEEFRPGDPRLMALALISMTNWSPWWLSVGDAFPVEQLMVQLADLAVAALRRPDVAAVPYDVGIAITQATDLLDTLRALNQK